MYFDTICAIATAMGTAGIGIVRISGCEAAEIAEKVFRSKNGELLADKPGYSITYGMAVDEEGLFVDEVLAMTMWAPKSYTGEDVVELHCHGGRMVTKKILELVLKVGARLAEPGEFSKRAFLNGKMDLTKAEAVIDIINAKTETAVYAAGNNLKGSIYHRLKEISRQLIEILAYLEADIDYPEEELYRFSSQELLERIQEQKNEIEGLLKTYKSGRIMREGLKTAIIGKPNVGKSSLLNAVLNAERAIVTEIPGTTRDIIEEYYDLGGIPLVLIDTAGIRETKDQIEKIGVEKTQEKIKEADIILYVLDLASGISLEDLEQIKGLNKEKVLVVINKVDLRGREVGEGKEEEIPRLLPGYKLLFISAKEKTGLYELQESIKEKVFAGDMEINEEPLLANVRQKDSLEKAFLSIKNAEDAVKADIPTDMAAIDLKQALLSIGEVTGETLDDEIVDKIFSEFCLGK